MAGEKILVIDDRAVDAEAISARLRWSGQYNVTIAPSAADGIDQVKRLLPALVILDIKMETTDAGFLVLKEMNADVRCRQIPVIIFSERGEELSVFLDGLALGAHWILHKSAGLERLDGYVRVALGYASHLPSLSAKTTTQGVSYNPSSRTFSLAGKEDNITLTRDQSRLLEYLSDHYGYVCTHEELIVYVFDVDSDSDREALKALVGRVRCILAKFTDNQLIHTHRGVGYMLKLTDQNNKPKPTKRKKIKPLQANKLSPS